MKCRGGRRVSVHSGLREFCFSDPLFFRRDMKTAERGKSPLRGRNFFESLSEIRQDLHQHLHAQLHVLHRNEFEASVIVFAAGTQVGTGQPLVA